METLCSTGSLLATYLLAELHLKCLALSQKPCSETRLTRAELLHLKKVVEKKEVSFIQQQNLQMKKTFC